MFWRVKKQRKRLYRKEDNGNRHGRISNTALQKRWAMLLPSNSHNLMGCVKCGSLPVQSAATRRKKPTGKSTSQLFSYTVSPRLLKIAVQSPSWSNSFRATVGKLARIQRPGWPKYFSSLRERQIYFSSLLFVQQSIHANTPSFSYPSKTGGHLHQEQNHATLSQI